MKTNFFFAGDLIESFFQSLDDNNIEYAVLRNYIGLPLSNSSKDIDILFNPSDIDNTHDTEINIILHESVKSEINLFEIKSKY